MAEAVDAPLVLVTGASGFIASHCIKLLLESGEYKIRGTVRSLKNEERCKAIRTLAAEPKYPIELVEANLLEEAGWKEAVKGCTYVLHIASPFTTDVPKHEDELIKPAVEGTLNVLKAAKEVGGVKRVVLTSSMASVMLGNSDKEMDESMWSDVTKCDAYSKSKTLAEKAAWDFVKELPDGEKFELSVINPGMVFGPILLGTCESFRMMRRMIMRELSMVPDIEFGIVDVRDVARAHIIAMTLPEAAGNRHCLVSEVRSFVYISRCVAEEFNSQGYKAPVKQAPKFLLWILSLFKSDVKMIYPYVGLKMRVNNSRLKDVLKVDPIASKDSAIEMCYTMIERGMIEKSPQYKGRGTEASGPAATQQSSAGDVKKQEEVKSEGDKDESAGIHEMGEVKKDEGAKEAGKAEQKEQEEKDDKEEEEKEDKEEEKKEDKEEEKPEDKEETKTEVKEEEKTEVKEEEKTEDKEEEKTEDKEEEKTEDKETEDKEEEKTEDKEEEKTGSKDDVKEEDAGTADEKKDES
eukprot:gene19123-21040_t